MTQEDNDNGRIAITTTFLPKRYPELAEFAAKYRGTSQLSSKMREFLILGMGIQKEQEQGNLVEVKIDLSDLKKDVAALIRAVESLSLPHYDATQHNEFEGVDISAVDDSVVGNLLSLGE